MNLSMISKSLLIALPMFALGACSSNSDSDVDSSETNAAKTEMIDEAFDDSTVQTDMIEAFDITDEDQLIQDYTSAILETTINFEFDKSTIAPRFTMILDAHAKLLVDNPEVSMTIEGHADEKGTPEYNIALGERRANAVATYLENMGVSFGQLTIVSYGEEKPFNLGHGAAADAENRRAKLVY